MHFVGHSRTSLLLLRSFSYLTKHRPYPRTSLAYGRRPTTRLDLSQLSTPSITMSTTAEPVGEAGKDTSMDLDTPTSTAAPVQASEGETSTVDQGEFVPSLRVPDHELIYKT